MKSFFTWLWGKIKTSGRWIVTLLILVAILIVALIISKNKSDDDSTSSSSSSRPEVAQVFEPSIGTPIPADTQTTPEPSAPAEVAQTPAPAATTPTTGTVAGSSTTTTYVAPKTGVNPNEPIVYKNSTYGFTVTLPAHSTVKDDGDIVSFFNGNGALLYSVSIERNAGSLDTIAEQLRNSAGVKNIVNTTATGRDALQFTTKSSNGLVILNGTTAYYLIGQKSYFTQFTF